MLISVKNTLDQNALYSFTSAAQAIGVGTVYVKNTASFQANWAIQLGKTGEEKSEIKLLSVSAPAGTSLVLTGTTSFDHPVDTPVYAVKFDQLVFMRSTSGTAGTAVAMTNGTVSITPDSLITQFDDTTGASTYAYKVKYRNSVTAETSNDSAWLTPSGYTVYSLYKIRDRIRNKLFSIGYLKNQDTQINDWINEWLEYMNNTAVEVNQDYNIGTVAVGYGTNGLATITSTDYKDLRKVDLTNDNINFYRARKISQTEVMPNQSFNSTSPFYYNMGDNVFGVKPDGTVGTAVVTYYRLGTVLSTDTDELPTVMKGYTKSFVDYGLAQGYYVDEKKAMGDSFMALAMQGKEQFKNEITPRSKTGPVTIRMTDAMEAEELYGLLF